MPRRHDWCARRDGHADEHRDKNKMRLRSFQTAQRRRRPWEPIPRCGSWMPLAQEACARSHGHRSEHRTRWAMDNARDMRSGIGWRQRERATA